MKTGKVQYTVRSIPSEVDSALRLRSRKEGKSLNDILVHSLAAAAGVLENGLLYRDLDWIAGTWVRDPACDDALSSQRTIDPDAWK